ncbi:MAG: hypothetical protein IPK60_17295 [Sandaracinaceae bacterium]|jgi:hypothetical protein|nr:hypothetical protein [Sandaracinaceae bacterium]
MLRPAPLDPAQELTPIERVGRYLLVARLVLVVMMFSVMLSPWHRVFRQDVPCGAQAQTAEVGVEPEFITACSGVVHPDGRAWMTPCLLILFFGLSIAAFRDQSRAASIFFALVTFGVVLALHIPITANLLAHTREANVGEPSCHVYSTVVRWPQRAFYYFFLVAVGGSVLEILTQFGLTIRDWIEDRRAAKAEAR